MPTAPLLLPDLPEPPGNIPWSANVRTAYSSLVGAYAHAARLSLQQSSEPLQLEVVRDRLIDLRPLLVGMEYDRMYPHWVEECAAALLAIDADLQLAQEVATGL